MKKITLIISLLLLILLTLTLTSCDKEIIVIHECPVHECPSPPEPEEPYAIIGYRISAINPVVRDDYITLVFLSDTSVIYRRYYDTAPSRPETLNIEQAMDKLGDYVKNRNVKWETFDI